MKILPQLDLGGPRSKDFEVTILKVVQFVDDYWNAGIVRYCGVKEDRVEPE